MKNQVIKVLTSEHGKKVIEYWNSKGVDTGCKIGAYHESDGNMNIYYGVINDVFDNYTIAYVKANNNVEIIELPTNKFDMTYPIYDLTTNEGRLAYAKKYYPIGTKYISLGSDGQVYRNSEITSTPRYFGNCIEGGFAYIYANGKWAEIIKEEINMGTQKLSRQGLKEIHSVACSSWKLALETSGLRNPLEDYVELTQEEVDKMFRACTKEQLPIVSKYLKQDDGSIDVTKFNVSGKGFCDNNHYIIRDREIGKYKRKSFLLSSQYSWEFREDGYGELCLIPTKKK